MNFPQMALLKQTFDSSRIDDIPATVTSELERVGVRAKIKPGQRVAKLLLSPGPKVIKALWWHTKKKNKLFLFLLAAGL